jgi:hypothetical protein
MEEAKLSPDEIMSGFDPFDEGDGEAHGLEDFPLQVREDVEGLMWLGHLEDMFTFCGHDFVIRTLKGDEELLASLLCKEFVETLGQARAWVWAQICMALVSVDGDENFCPPVSANKRDYAKARFQYCTRNWFWPLAAHIYSRYTELLERQNEAMSRVEDLFNGSQPTSSPSAGSSSDLGDLEEPREQDTQPQEDIRDHLDMEDSTESKPDSSPS